MKPIKTILIFSISVFLATILFACSGAGAGKSGVVVSFECGDGQKIEDMTFEKGVESIELPMPNARAGFEFVGWFATKDRSGEPMPRRLEGEAVPTRNVELYAKWAKKKVSVSFVIGERVIGATFDYGTRIAAKDYPPGNDEYAFEIEEFAATADRRIVAKRIKAEEPTLYVVFCAPDESGEYVEIARSAGRANEIAEMPDAPEAPDGQMFAGWYRDAGLVEKCAENPTFSEPEVRLYAKFLKLEDDAEFLEWEEVEGGVAISGLNELGRQKREICVPERIGGKKVVRIGLGATRERVAAGAGGAMTSRKLETVIIPAGVASVGAWAFAGCVELREAIFVGDEIVAIGEGAFAGCASLEAFDLPASVTAIGDYAFAGIEPGEAKTAEEARRLPDGFRARDMAFAELRAPEASELSGLGDYCFYNCKRFKSVVFGRSIDEINHSAFLDSGIESIGFCPNGRLREIGGSVYAGSGAGLKLAYRPLNAAPECAVAPNTVEIMPNAFRLNAKLEKVTANPELETIGASAFDGSGLRRAIGFGESSLKKICEGAFRDCARLEAIELPASVRSVGKDAFRACRALKAVEIGRGAPSEAEGGGLERIGECAFAECAALTEIFVPNSTKELLDGAFRECAKLRKVEFEEDGALETIGDYAFFECVELVEAEIPRSAKHVGKFAFASIGNAMKFSVPNADLFLPQVEAIGERAFMNASLVSIAIPASAAELGEYAFAGCKKLKSARLVRVGPTPKGLFAGCASLEAIDLAHATEVGDEAFMGCVELTEAKFGKRIARIGESAFEGCAKLDGGPDARRVLPKSLTELGRRAFCGCKALTSATIPKGLAIIPESAFAHCAKLASVGYDPDCSTHTVSRDAFAHCVALTSATLPDRLKPRGDGDSEGLVGNPFVGCSNLTEFAFATPGDARGEDGAYSVRDGILRRKIRDAEGVVEYAVAAYPTGRPSGDDDVFLVPAETRIVDASGDELVERCVAVDARAFSGCLLKGIEFAEREPGADGVVEVVPVALGAHAFSDMPNLESLCLSHRVCGLGPHCLENSNVSVLTIDGADISKDGISQCGEKKYKFAAGTDAPERGNAFEIEEYALSRTKISEIVVPKRVTGIGAGAFADDYALEKIEFSARGAATLTVGARAFANDNRIAAVAFPPSLVELGAGAFESCGGLKDVTFGARADSDSTLKLVIGPEAFKNATYLYRIALPRYLSELGEGAFRGATRLKYAIFPDALDDGRKMRLSDRAFDGMPALMEFEAKRYVSEIGAEAFRGSSLERIAFEPPEAGDELKIGARAFAGLEGLERAELPPHLTSLGAGAFESSGLRSVEVAESGARFEIGARAFAATRLEEFRLGSRPSAMGEGCFEGIPTLRKFDMTGSDVSTIPDRAFAGCAALEELALARDSSGRAIATKIGAESFLGVGAATLDLPFAEEIGERAFAGSRLAEIAVRNETPGAALEIAAGAFFGAKRLVRAEFETPGKISVGVDAFGACPELTTLKFRSAFADLAPGFAPGATRLAPSAEGSGVGFEVVETSEELGRFASVDGVLYSRDGQTLVFYPAGRLGSTYALGANVSAIADRAFAGCAALTGLMLERADFVRALGGDGKYAEPLPGFPAGYYLRMGAEGAYEFAPVPAEAERPDVGETYYALRYAPALPGDGKYADADETPLPRFPAGYCLRTGAEGAYEFAPVPAEAETPEVGETYYVTRYAPALPGDGKYAEPLPGFPLGYFVRTGEGTEASPSAYAQATEPEPVEGAEYHVRGVVKAARSFEGMRDDLVAYVPDRLEAEYASRWPDVAIRANETGEGGLALTETVSGDLAVSGYLGSDSTVRVPSVVSGRAVVEISANAFRNCAHLEKIAIGDGIKTIEKNAFDGCANLVEAEIGRGVASVKNNAFRGCAKLRKVSFAPGSRLTAIGNRAFEGCDLESFDAPSGLETIGAYAFAGCARLGRIALGERLETIDDNAFEGCRSLVGLEAPKSAREIGSRAFDGCSGLVYVDFKCDAVCAIREDTFGSDGDGPFAFVPASLVGRYREDKVWRKRISRILTSEDRRTEPGFENYVLRPSETGDEYVLDSYLGLDFATGGYETDVVLKPRFADGKPIASIGEKAFGRFVERVAVPDGYRSIDARAFCDATNLRVAILPYTLEEIGDLAFAGLTRLETAVAEDFVAPEPRVEGAPGRFYAKYFGAPGAERKMLAVEFPELWMADGSGQVVASLTADALEIVRDASGAPSRIALVGGFALDLGDEPAFMRGEAVAFPLRRVSGGALVGSGGLEARTLDGGARVRVSVRCDDCDPETGRCSSKCGIEFVERPERRSADIFLPEGKASLVARAGAFESRGLRLTEGESDRIRLGFDAERVEETRFAGPFGFEIRTSPDGAELVLPGGSALALGATGEAGRFRAEEGGKEIVLSLGPARAEISFELARRSFATRIFAGGITVAEPDDGVRDLAFPRGPGLALVSTSARLRSIGREAFRGCVGLSSFSVPASVTRIGAGAFSDPNGMNLERVSFAGKGLADAPIAIGENAFANNVKLRTLRVDRAISELGAGAFGGCEALEAFYMYVDPSIRPVKRWIPKTPGGSAFGGCDRLSVILPDGLVSDYKKAMKSASALDASRAARLSRVCATDAGVAFVCEEVGTGDSVTIANCIGAATEIAFPDYVVIDGKARRVTRIGRARAEIPESELGDSVTGRAIGSGVTKIRICAGVKIIGRDAFRGAVGLTDVEFESGSELEKIEKYAFRDCLSLRRIAIPASTRQILPYAFAGCASLAQGPGRLEFVSPNYGSTLDFGGRAFADCVGLTEFELPKHVSRVGRCADDSAIVGHTFDGCVNLSSFEFAPGSRLVDLGECSFRGSALETLDLPESLLVVRAGAFAGCAALRRVAVSRDAPDSESRYTLARDSNLFLDDSDARPNPHLKIYVPAAPDAFAWYSGSDSNWVGEGRTVIMSTVTDDGRFAYESEGEGYVVLTDCRESRETLVVPRSVQARVGDSIRTFLVNGLGRYFANASVRKVEFAPDSVLTSLRDCAFAGCSALEEIHIPVTVTNIGERAFADCSSLADVVLPEYRDPRAGLARISRATFENCVSLREISLPKNLRALTEDDVAIGENAFYGCSGLERVEIRFAPNFDAETLGRIFGENAFVGAGVGAAGFVVIVPDDVCDAYSKLSVGAKFCMASDVVGDFVVESPEGSEDRRIIRQYVGAESLVDLTSTSFNGEYATGLAPGSVASPDTRFVVGKDFEYADQYADRITVREAECLVRFDIARNSLKLEYRSGAIETRDLSRLRALKFDAERSVVTLEGYAADSARVDLSAVRRFELTGGNASLSVDCLDGSEFSIPLDSFRALVCDFDSGLVVPEYSWGVGSALELSSLRGIFALRSTDTLVLDRYEGSASRVDLSSVSVSLFGIGRISDSAFESNADVRFVVSDSVEYSEKYAARAESLD